MDPKHWVSDHTNSKPVDMVLGTFRPPAACLTDS